MKLSLNPIATKVNPDMVRIFRGVSGSVANYHISINVYPSYNGFHRYRPIVAST